MDLRQLLSFDHITIQCHDNPDADSIAAGFGLYRYFSGAGKRVDLVYGGRNAVNKPNLVKMLELLHIPLQHRPEPQSLPGLLVTVDCQHGAGNVSPMSARDVAVIDHHIQECPAPALHDIRPYLGSCATLVWILLREADFSIDQPLATALYYGLFTDTNGFSEVRHPLDRDLRDSLEPAEGILKILKNSNLSLEDLSIASSALQDLRFDKQGRFAVVSTKPCDPNILGFISDLAMQVDNVDAVLVYSELPGGIKYSVRTVTREARASDIAAWLAADGLGSGGGHAEKAGGYISSQNFSARCPGVTPAEYLTRRLQEYRSAYATIDCVDSGTFSAVDTGGLEVFEKLPVRLAFVPCSKITPERTTLHIRMLEGDISAVADAETCLMIGLEGEVYPIAQKKFEETYSVLEGLLHMHFEYPPTVLDKDTGKRISLEELALPCESKGGGRVLAVPLKQRVKLFTRWDPDTYIKGEPGDWLVRQENDPADMYIVTAAVFPRLYGKPGQTRPADFTGVDVSTVAGSKRVRKKSVTVRVSFATQAGILETREGRVPYAPGDALLTGTAGERWPVCPEHFEASYAPVPPGAPAQDGVYAALPVEAWGLKPQAPFMVFTSGGALLQGTEGDWLLQYASGDYGVVGKEFFEKLYEVT